MAGGGAPPGLSDFLPDNNSVAANQGTYQSRNLSVSAGGAPGQSINTPDNSSLPENWGSQTRDGNTNRVWVPSMGGPPLPDGNPRHVSAGDAPGESLNVHNNNSVPENLNSQTRGGNSNSVWVSSKAAPSLSGNMPEILSNDRFSNGNPSRSRTLVSTKGRGGAPTLAAVHEDLVSSDQLPPNPPPVPTKAAPANVQDNNASTAAAPPKPPPAAAAAAAPAPAPAPPKKFRLVVPTTYYMEQD